MKSLETKGIVMALIGAALWGVSGTMMQFLFANRGVSAEWMVTVRMLISGTCLLAYGLAQTPSKVLDIWRRGSDVLTLVVFTVFGMISVQYTYFAAIRDSNAATATVLQFTAPVVIAAWYAIRERRLPGPIEALSIALAIFGTWMLVTRGDPTNLSISPSALVWGLGSAIATAIYSIQPQSLMRRFPAPVVLGWAMVVGGALFSFIHAPWAVTGTWDMAAFGAATFGILGGTLVAFLLYIQATQLIGARKASLAASAEPVAATAIAVIFLKVDFGLPEFIGTACIIATILLLSLRRTQSPSIEAQPAE